ncbi:MAG: hypothetical protein AB1422_12655 [bacterium]
MKTFLFSVFFSMCCIPLAWAQQLFPGAKIIDDKVIKIPSVVQVATNIRDVQLTTRLTLEQIDKQNVEKATKLLINQQLATLVGRSSSVRPIVTVLQRVGKKLLVESLVVFRDKTTYSATLSKMDYEVEGDQVILKQKIDDYSPRIAVLQKPGAPKAETLKIKKDILANLKISLPQGYGPKALANTPCDDISTAVQYTNQIHNIFVQAFGLAEKKIGNKSTKAALMNILQKGTRLLAWNNIGHGNPDLIVEWNDKLITHADFNTPTSFEGVYNAVILLNSCDTCASPYHLKNAIMNHNPRTFIAGSKGLPIGSSEEVDYHFWNYSLLQNQTMAWSLNEAEKKKNLLGYFCLNGYNGKFAEVEAAKFTEDCIPFDYKKVKAKNVNGRWKVVQGSMWMLDFGTNKSQAEKAIEIMKHYKLDRQCFVGRPDAPMQYYTTGGKAPQGSLAGEDCISFNPNNVTAKNIGGHWKVVDGSHWLLDFGNKEAESKIAVEIIKFYGFKQICFVGRPNAPMMYFKK